MATEVSIDWSNFFSTDQSKPIVVIGLSIDNSKFFDQVTEGFCGVSFVSCFGLFVCASFWFTDLVIHCVCSGFALRCWAAGVVWMCCFGQC